MRKLYGTVLALMSLVGFGSETPPAMASNANSPVAGTASAASIETQGVSADRSGSEQRSNIQLANCCVVLGVRG